MRPHWAMPLKPRSEGRAGACGRCTGESGSGELTSSTPDGAGTESHLSGAAAQSRVVPRGRGPGGRREGGDSRRAEALRVQPSGQQLGARPLRAGTSQNPAPDPLGAVRAAGCGEKACWSLLLNQHLRLPGVQPLGPRPERRKRP